MNAVKTITVLIVDDEPDLLKVVADYLRSSAYIILTATNGVDALRIVATQNVTVLLVDLIIPNMDGVEIVRRVREIKPDIKILIMSGYPSYMGQTELGVSGLLNKPFTKDDVVTLLDSILNEDTTLAEMKAQKVEAGASATDKYLKEVLDLNRDNRVILTHISVTLQQLEKGSATVVNLLENKVDDLINALKGKDMMPVSAFKWLVIFVMIFSFLTFFGRSVTSEIMEKLAGHSISSAEGKK